MAATELGIGAAVGEADRYRLERVLGIGGMASVWLASDELLERPVAVKLLADTLALDREYVTRFEREARVAAGLSHPHLVKVFDFDTGPPRPYLVMEYVAGGSLAGGAETWGEPDLDPEALVRQLLAAIDYIHRAGVIHRDIKPANVLIDTDGRARVTDFGIARPADATRLTRTGIVLGSERYLAPEVWQGQPSTAQSDLYACGVLIRECLPGRPGSRLPALVAALTAQAPAGRPASAREALAMLEAPAKRSEAARSRPVPSRAAQSRPAWSEPDPTRRQPMRGAPARPRTAATVRAPGRHRRAPALTAVVALLAAVAVVLAIILATSPSSPAGRGPVATPANASLQQQLNSLARAVAASRR